jgi:hypothetical protein
MVLDMQHHHYSVGRKFDGNVFCHVAMASSENSLPPKYSARCRTHSVTTKEYSKCIKQLRGRVESPFGWVKNKWKSLNVKWAESEEEQEKLIYFTEGVHNHGNQ